MPFIPPVSPPIPLLDACVYAALGDLIPSAVASADVRLAVSFSAGSIIGTLTAAERALARLTFDPPAFHEALLTIATALGQIGGHQVSALDQRFRLDTANEERGAVDSARLSVLWPPRAADAAPPLTLIAHACANEGSLAVVVHLTPDAAQALISTGASFLDDLAEAADLIQSAAGLSRARAALRMVSERATARSGLAMSAETSSAHFFYSTLNGPRGFPLALASFFFSPEKAPSVPSDTAVRAMLQSRAPSVPISTAAIAAYVRDARAWLPAAQEAFTLLPFRITVHIPGITQNHSLRFANAVRFARAMGLLRWCKDCQRHTLIFEPDSDICEDCGYRALDSA